MSQSGRPFTHGFEFYLEKATLAYSSAGLALTVYVPDGKSNNPDLGGGDAIDSFAAEIQTAVAGVAAGKEPALLSGQLARDALVLCHKECQSVRTGKVVSVA